MAVKSHEIHLRIDFPLLLNWRCLYGPIVEIGVDRAGFSDIFLQRWYGNDYIGVDNFCTYPDVVGTRAADILTAATIYARYHTRARLITGESLEVAKPLRESLSQDFDFVYVDGGHKYKEVLDDMETWWQFIAARGILAGHDYDDTHPDVIRAVDEFATTQGREVYLTDEVLPSWYIYKSGIPSDADTARRLK